MKSARNLDCTQKVKRQGSETKFNSKMLDNRINQKSERNLKSVKGKKTAKTYDNGFFKVDDTPKWKKKSRR